MEFSFKLAVEASKETIWGYYENLDKWSLWETDLEDIKLADGFKSGSAGVMKLAGIPAMEFILTSVIKYAEFWDKTVIPMGSIVFGHTISEENGKIFIKHTVRLENAMETAENIEFLKKVFADVPSSMFELKQNAEKTNISIKF